MKQEAQLKEVRRYIRSVFQYDTTGHDFEHMRRVAQIAKKIAIEEGADPFICELAGWLHDIGDHKLFTDPAQEVNKMNACLTSIDITEKQRKQLHDIIHTVSFSKGLIPETKEGKIAQDADRLDAIGAIGIARTFQFGGAHNQLIYHEKQQQTSIGHFYDKLLKIKDLIQTATAKEIATERHLFMEKFLEQFYKEWD